MRHIFLNHSKDSTDTLSMMSKPNEKGVQITQVELWKLLKLLCIFVNDTMNVKERHHIWKNSVKVCQISIEFICPTFWAKYRRIKYKSNSFKKNIKRCVSDQILKNGMFLTSTLPYFLSWYLNFIYSVGSIYAVIV